MDRGGPLLAAACERTRRARSSTTCRRPTWRATSTCCGGGRRRAADLRRLLLRLVSGRDLRQPVPRAGSRGRRRRRARPDRLVDGRRRPRSDRAVLDAPAQRRRRAGDARGVLPACATPAATACAFSGGAARAVRGTGRRLLREPIDHRSRHRRRSFFRLLGPDRRRRSGRCTTRSLAGLRRLPRLPRRAGGPGDAGPGARRAWGRRDSSARTRISPYPNFDRGISGVACSDSVNPRRYAAWSAAADASEAQFGYFGRIWTWVSSPCAPWPGVDADRYLGPFNRLTSSPLLVVGTTFDPATRYEGSVTVSNLMPNSSLLTVHGWGHTSLLLSTCSEQAIAAYLLTGATPPVGTVCEQDLVPFTAAAAAAAAPPTGEIAARQFLRSNLVPEAARPDRRR